MVVVLLFLCSLYKCYKKWTFENTGQFESTSILCNLAVSSLVTKTIFENREKLTKSPELLYLLLKSLKFSI